MDMLTLRERQEQAARRAARIAAKHMAIRSAALGQGEARETRSTVMKKNEVKVGGQYIAKVSGKLVQVRVTGTSGHGGWDAVNEATGKKVRIKSAQRLRGEAKPKTASKAADAAPVGAGAKPAAEVAKDAKVAPAAAVGKRDAAGAKPDAATDKAGKVAAWRKDVAAKLAKPDPANAAAAKAAREAHQAKKAKPTPKKRDGMSGLDAAAKVLALAGKPMNTKQMVDKMLADGLWKTGGKTPAATIYAAILREVRAKGKDARFRKTDRGQFEATAAARQ
jgi:hypothetical protein